MGCTILGLRLYRKLGKNLKINKFIYKPKSIINNSTPSKNCKRHQYKCYKNNIIILKKNY